MPCALKVLAVEALAVLVIGLFAALRAGKGAIGPTKEPSE